MTMMNGLDRRELDILDEDYFGPPPRFLREGRPIDFCIEGEEDRRAHGSTLAALQKIKAFLGMC